MTAQTYQAISCVGFIFAAVFLVISLIFWVGFGIRKIIGDLSGRTARKAIARMRKSNEASGEKNNRFTPVAAGGEAVPMQEPLVMPGGQTEILNGETVLLAGGTDS
ncbi:MAG: hypothetical protein LUC83_09870 [Clostridiales bacterium]|nr:hypothetical protein [Clostridiales bacterium]